MMKLLLVALLAVVAVQAQPTVPVQGNIDLIGQGSSFALKTSLKANTTYTVTTLVGFQAIVDVKADCQVWFGAHFQFTNLPTGWNQVVNVANIGINVGFGLFVDVQGAINSAILQSPPVPTFGQEIANGFNAAALALNNATGYSYLQVTYDPESKRISLALPSSLPLIIFGKVQSQASATLNNPFNFVGGANQTITFDANTAITFRSQVANTITVARTNVATSGQLSAIANIGRGLGVFVNVSLAVQAAHDSILRISYNAQDLINQGIKDEANLKLAVWNELTNTWDLGNWVSVVNTTAHWIEARVPHFSTWAPIEALQASTNITTPTGLPGTVSIQANIDLTGQGLVIKTSLKAGIKYTVTTLVGFQAIVDVKADCHVWFGAHLQFTNLPTGWNQVVNVASIGINVGFGLFVDTQGALNSVILQSPPVPLFGQDIANGFNAAALALTNATGAPVYSYLQVTYDPESQRISLALPSSLPIIIFGKIQSQASATLNNPFNFIGGANQTVTFDANTAITFRSQVGNTITVARGNWTTSGALSAIVKAGRGLGIYVNVSLAVEAAQDSTLRISYNAQDLINAGIKNEANLKLAVFNPDTGAWDFGNWISVVNTTAHYIEARVPHFSTWSPIEQTSSPSPTGTASQTSISMVLMAALAMVAALFQ